MRKAWQEFFCLKVYIYLTNKIWKQVIIVKIGAAYIRVSTEDQIEFSPDSQLKNIKEYAKRNDIILPEKFVFIDEAISGKSAETRPEFMKMIKISKSKPKPFDVILVWKFSRFARNRQDSIVYKSVLRKECKIDVISITEQLPNEPTSILIEALLEAMDEYYSVNLAEEVKRGMNEKFSRGGVVNLAPFGYEIVENYFKPKKFESEIVKMIFNDFKNGFSVKEIAFKLNKMKIFTKRGNKFEPRAVKYILLNPFYIGKMRRNLIRNNKKDRFKTGSEFQIINGNHEAIIDEKTFEIVNQSLLNSAESKRKHYDKSNFAFSGIIFCSNCGSSLLESAKGKSLQCSKYAKGRCSVSHSISVLKISNALKKALKTEFGGEILNISVSENSAFALKMLLKKEKSKFEKIASAYESGVDSLEEYKAKKSEVLCRIESIENKLSAFKKFFGRKIKIKFESVVDAFFSGILSEPEKNKILKLFIQKIIFNRKEGTIRIYYKI